MNTRVHSVLVENLHVVEFSPLRSLILMRLREITDDVDLLITITSSVRLREFRGLAHRCYI